MYKKNILNFINKYKNLFIIISFFIFSIISTSLLIHSHFLGGGTDTYFHWQRIIELKKSFGAKNFFPKLALNEFSSNGSAVMSFYPYLNLVPITLLSYIIKNNILLIYCSFNMYIFIALLIGYYSSLHITQRVDTSYIFSIMYILSSSIIYQGFYIMDLGILNSMLILPLIIFGFINFIKNNNWIELSIGIILIIFTHVLNSIFIIFFLFIWLFINLKKINYCKIMSLIKCIGLVLITTSIFYIPFFKLMVLNKINRPSNFILTGVSFIDLFKNAITNNVYDTLGIFAFLGAFIVPLFFYNKFNCIIKQIYWLSIIIIIISSNFFPWYLFQNTIINNIQFPWRLYFIPQLLLTYIFSLSITKYLYNNNIRIFSILLIIIITLILQIDSQTQIVDKFLTYRDLNHEMFNGNGLGNYKISNSLQMNNLSSGFSSADYYPQESMARINQLRNNQGIYDINKYLQFYSLGNGISTFHNHNKINELNVPFVRYRGIKYQVYLDNHPVSFKVNKTKLFTLNNVQKGKHYIKIKTIPNISDIIIRILFFIGILIYLWLFFIKYFNKYKLLK